MLKPLEIPVKIDWKNSETKDFYQKITDMRTLLAKSKEEFYAQYKSAASVIQQEYLGVFDKIATDQDFRIRLYQALMAMPTKDKQAALDYFNGSFLSDEDRKQLISLAVRFFLYGDTPVFMQESTKASIFSTIKPLASKVIYCLP